MIPFDRAFLGSDLDDLRQRFGFTVDDMCFFAGVTRNRWFLMTKKEASLPVRDVPLALMCRLIDEDKDLLFVPDFTSPQTLLSRIEEDRDITLREFSVLMGNNGTSANRWTRGRKRASPQVYRLAHVVDTMANRNGMTKALMRLRNAVNIEAMNRGIRDIFSAGKWTVKGDPTKELRVKPKPAKVK